MRMTRRAEDQLTEILASEKKYLEANEFVPLIGWVFNRKGENEDPGPVLGFMERSRVVNMQPYETRGLLIYDGLPEHMSRFFENCELDLIEGNFNFVRDGKIIIGDGQPPGII